MSTLLTSNDSSYLFDLARAQVIEQSEYLLFSMLKPTLVKEGNEWMVLYGDNIQEGICGFGGTPYLAIIDFNNRWHEKASTFQTSSNKRI